MVDSLNSQSSYDVTCDQGLDAPDQHVDDGYDPDDFPVSMLNGTRIPCSNHMDAANTYQGPEEGEAPHGVGIVQVGRLCSIDGEWPIQRRERRRGV